MINISTYRNLSVDDLFAHPTTILRNIIKKAESAKSDLTIKLKDIFHNYKYFLILEKINYKC